MIVETKFCEMCGKLYLRPAGQGTFCAPCVVIASKPPLASQPLRSVSRG
jgi:hypothetical protein